MLEDIIWELVCLAKCQVVAQRSTPVRVSSVLMTNQFAWNNKYYFLSEIPCYDRWSVLGRTGSGTGWPIRPAYKANAEWQGKIDRSRSTFREIRISLWIEKWHHLATPTYRVNNGEVPDPSPTRISTHTLKFLFLMFDFPPLWSTRVQPSIAF